MLNVKCKINNNNNNSEEKPYGKSIHTEEKPHIYDFIIVSFIKNSDYKNNLLSNL